MPICIDCGSSYADTLISCPSCGKPNQADPAALVACPTCHQADQVFKVAEIETRTDLQNSDLQEKLDFPPKPAAPEINIVLTVGGVLLMFAALFGLIRVQTGNGPLIFAVCMVLAVVCFLRGRVNSKQANAYLEAVKKWRTAKAEYDQLYYCPTCDTLFLPGQSAAPRAERMAEFHTEAK